MFSSIYKGFSTYRFVILLIIAVVTLTELYVIRFTKKMGVNYSAITTVCESSMANSYHAVIMDSISSTRLEHLGGTGQWYHYAESLIPSLFEAKHSSLGPSNFPLLIVFQDRAALESLDAFGRFLSTAVLSNGEHRRIIFGLADEIEYINFPDGGSGVKLFGFIRGFGVDLDNQIPSARFLEDDASVVVGDDNTMVCARVLYKHSWNAFPNKHWFDSRKNITTLTNAMHNICSIDAIKEATAVHLSKQSSADVIRDDIELLDSYRGRKVDFKPLLVSGASKKVIIYQRDAYRRILNEATVKRKLFHYLNNDDDIPTPLLRNGYKNSNVTQGEWSIETVMHTNFHPPCVLLNTLSSATVLITPHGFQSLLLLMQPYSSVLIEIFPKWFYKPYVYGSIQTGYRTSEFSRSYLCEESVSTSYWASFVHSLLYYGCGGGKPLKNEATGVCNRLSSGSSIRYGLREAMLYVAKNQDTIMSEGFLKRVGIYIRSHFV